MKFGIWLQHCTTVPKKARTSVVFLQGPHRIIFPIASQVGFLPLYKQSNPTMVMWSSHIFVLGPEKVPLAYFILCNILLTIPKCSKINLLIPGFLSSTSTVPSGSSYVVSGPQMGTSSIYSRVYFGISSLRIYVTSSWNIGTEFVHPIGKVTSLSTPNSVWNVVRSLEHSASIRSLYPTYKSRIPPQVLPAKYIASSSVASGSPECAMVTLLRGSRLCTMRRLFPSFFITQNYREW